MPAGYIIGFSSAVFVTDSDDAFSLASGVPIIQSSGSVSTAIAIESANTFEEFDAVIVAFVETVTADSTVWTADTHCVTADGRIVCVAADVAEAAGALDVFDALVVAGGAVISADVLEAADALDGFAAVAVFVAAMDEPAGALDEVVAAIGAQVLFGTVAEATDAVDQLDAALEAAAAVGGGVGGYYPPPRPFPVEGFGFGILPQLEGDAHGVVVVVGAGVGALPQLRGEAAGSVGVAGRSAAQLALVRAAAIGNSGQAGAVIAVLKGLSVRSAGAIGVHGSGIATLEIKGAAAGRHDDDEAAVMTFLLAA